MDYRGGPRAGDPVRVLIVDDDEDMLGLLAPLCAALGLEVCGTTQDPLEAIRIVVKTWPDLVLLDQMIPRISAAETTEIVRDLAPDTRIIGLLASAEEVPPQWCDAGLAKTQPDRFSAILDPLLGPIERAREVRRKRSAPEPATSNVRPRLTQALAEPGDGSHVVHIGLEHNHGTLMGESENASESNAVVAATLEAVKPLLDFDVGLVEIDFLQVGEDRVAVVVLDRQSDWLVGSALVRTDVHDSLARATLDAVNRFLRPVDPPQQPTALRSSVAG